MTVDPKRQLSDPLEIKAYYASPEVVQRYEDERFSGADRLKHVNEARAVRWMLRRRAGPLVWEVASGTGRLARAMALAGHRVACLDYSLPMLAYSRQQAASRESRPTGWVRADAFHLPAQDESIDAAICFRFLRHFADPERTALWRELRRVLKPGGYLALDVPNAEWHADVEQRFIHDQAYSLPSFGQEVEDHGFRLVRVWGNGYVPLGRRPLGLLWRLDPLVNLRSLIETELLSRVAAWRSQAHLWSVGMPKVLMVGHEIEPSPPYNEAIKNQCRWLAGELQNRGWSVSFMSRSREASPGVVQVDGMRVVRLPSPTFALHARAWSALGLAAIETWIRPNVIHFWGAFSLLPIPRSALGWRPDRLVVSLYRPPSSERGLRLLRRMADWPLEMVAEDENLLPIVEAAGGEPAAIVPPGVDTERLLPRQRPPGRRTWFGFFASAPLGKEGDDEEAYLVSRGVEMGLRLGELVSRLVSFQQVLLWRAPVSQRVRDMVARTPSATVLQTVVPDLADYVECFDLCFMLSDDSPRAKSVPLSAIEALARGIPVVVRAGSALAGPVAQAGAGFVVEDEQLARAAEEIAFVLGQPNRYATMAASARALACQRFSLDRMVASYERVYLGDRCTSAC